MQFISKKLIRFDVKSQTLVNSIIIKNLSPSTITSQEKSQYRYKSTTYQYLHKSSLPTQKFQKSLPRLPIPELSKTCQRYLEALKPIIASQDQYDRTRETVKRFESGDGAKLHSELIQQNKRNSNTSYISEPWFDMYLKSRLPLPLNYNPFMAWKDDPTPSYNTQLLRTTNMIVSALRFRRSLIENVLEPEVFHLNPVKSDTKFYRNVIRLTPSQISTYVSFAFKAFPLDMSQFDNLFTSTRIPKLSRDELITYPQSKHIVVMKKGHFYVFDVLDSNGDLKEPSEILTNIKYILDLNESGDANSISVMTTEDRDVWAKVREEMINSSAVNKDSIGLIDSAQFVICLDDVSLELDDLIRFGHHFLHGCSKTDPIVNRWFDKSFSIITTNNGHASINFEHSWGDGVAVLRFFNEIYKDSALNNHHVHPDSHLNKSIDPSKEVKKLQFQLNDNCKNSIKDAAKNFRKNVESLRLDMLLYSKMNRDYFKKKKLSPDSMFQLGFQMAYYTVYNSPAATYEACSTAAFKHGRTETVRSATSATKAATEAFLSKNKNNSQLRQLLDECSKKHFQLTKEAAMGQGFDRHLFAMKIMAEKLGIKVPELYNDKSYIEANHFILSTSTLFGEYFQGGGFAPVVQNGFGCGYGYVDNTLGVLVSSHSPHRNGKQFVDAFEASLNNIFEVLENCK